MSVSNLVLEIGVEEIPSGYFNHIHDILSSKSDSPIRGLFESNNISAGSISSYSTPRRIILHIEDIPTSQDIKIDGPPLHIAYDENKKPTKALLAFLKKFDAKLDSVDNTQEERVSISRKDVSNKEILAKLLPKLIRELDFPKTMRWDEDGFMFARPIRWVLALFGSEIIKFNIAGIDSSNITYGHRFLGSKKIKIKDSKSFFYALEKNHIIYDNSQRKDKILSFLEKKSWHKNSLLLDEVTNLVEYPVFIEGSFKDEYLQIPEEVLLASMAKHQRVFCLQNKDGSLKNRFVGVLNGNYKGKRQIIKNFENVLDAKLKDALFFYKSDTKKSLTEWSKGLSDVVFHKKLGTLSDKTVRIKQISDLLSKAFELDQDQKKDMKKAISLSKADLLTEMVGEFPSLQGVVGSYYALHSGENDAVSNAIKEHYLPKFSDDELPDSEIGTLISLADKLDNIVSYFKIGKYPKGGWDLYALRRQGIGIISILISKEIPISLSKVFDFAFDLAPGECDREKLKKIFLDFFKDRFFNYVKSKFGFRHDLIECVLLQGVDDIYNSYLKLEALNSIIDENYFEKARSIVERTHNILKGFKERPNPVKVSLFAHDEEQLLYDGIEEIESPFKQLVLEKRFKEATELFGDSLYNIIHNFFDKVMVNVDKKDIKANRLSLLMNINRLYVDSIADLSKIVVNNEKDSPIKEEQ